MRSRRCKEKDCGQPHVAQGLCEAHYRTLRKYGQTESPFGYGNRRKHPLYESWRWQVRVKEGRVKEWDDFWVFVKCVGEKKDKHRLRRLNPKEAWSPDNFFWQEITVDGDKAHKMREWKKKNPLRAKGYDLKSNYGITLDRYMEMYDEQGGKCAICEKEGTSYSKGNGRTTTLVVDHCHKELRNRKLLCSDCNKGLGSFKDSAELLGRAIKYLSSQFK